MKALLIQSLILFLATVAHGYTPEMDLETHDVTMDLTPIILTAKQRNMRFHEKDQQKYVKTMATHFCNYANYARVAETPSGEPIYRVDNMPAQDLPNDRPLMAWTADGVTSVDKAFATKWKTTYSDERDKKIEFPGSGPALVFTRLRCMDKYQ